MKIALATCRDLPEREVDDLPLHQALEELGIEIHLAIWNDPKVDWASCDACLIRTTWDYTNQRDEFVTWADRVAGLTRLFNPPDVIRWNTHKSYLRDLEQRGVPTVPTIWIEQGASVDLQSTLRDRGWTQGFLKPQIAATARGTLRFHVDSGGLEAAQAHLQDALTHGSMMLQPYLETVETKGELSVILFGGEVSHVVQKIPVPGDYRVQDDFGAADRPSHLDDRLIDLVQRIQPILGKDLLYARIDALENANGDLMVNELELVEPSLFFRHGPDAAEKLAGLLHRRIAQV